MTPVCIRRNERDRLLSLTPEGDREETAYDAIRAAVPDGRGTVTLDASETVLRGIEDLVDRYRNETGRYLDRLGGYVSGEIGAINGRRRARFTSNAGCWCGRPFDHPWRGRADGAPHPPKERLVRGTGEGCYLVMRGDERIGEVRRKDMLGWRSGPSRWVAYVWPLQRLGTYSTRGLAVSMIVTEVDGG